MKLLSTIAAVSALTLGASGAYAQSTFDGTIGVDYIHAPDDGHDYQAQINGSVVFGISPSISFQLDLGATKNEDDASADFNYGIHAIYSPSDALDFGVFFSQEIDGYHYGGVEVAYRTGAFEIEAHAEIEDIMDSTSYFNVGAQVGYTIDGIGSLPNGITVYAGFDNQYETGVGVYLPNYFVGVKANVWDNLDVNARVASMDDGDYMYYTVGFSYNFGNGATFTPRDFASTFPGY